MNAIVSKAADKACEAVRSSEPVTVLPAWVNEVKVCHVYWDAGESRYIEHAIHQMAAHIILECGCNIGRICHGEFDIEGYGRIFTIYFEMVPMADAKAA